MTKTQENITSSNQQSIDSAIFKNNQLKNIKPNLQNNRKPISPLLSQKKLKLDPNAVNNITHYYAEKLNNLLRDKVSNSLVVQKHDHASLIQWNEFQKQIASETVAITLNLNGTEANCVILLDKSLLYYLLQVMLGGGSTNDLEIVNRALSAVEISFLHDLSEIFCNAFNKLFMQMSQAQSTIYKIDLDASHITSFADETWIITNQISFCNAEQMQPITLIWDQNLMPDLAYLAASAAIHKSVSNNQNNSTLLREKLLNRIKTLDAIIVAEISTTSITLHNASKLRIGDTIIINQTADDDINLKVSGKTLGYGQLGQSGQYMAIKIGGFLDQN